MIVNINSIFTTEEYPLRIIVQNMSETPIYQQIYNQLREGILYGKLNEDDALPSIRALARDLQISVITTTRAYNELEKDGYIMIVQGKGCFVKSINNHMIADSLQYSIETNLTEAIKIAKLLKKTDFELVKLLKELWEEYENE